MEQLKLNSDSTIYFTSSKRPVPRWNCDMSECIFPDEAFANATTTLKIKLYLKEKEV